MQQQKMDELMDAIHRSSTDKQVARKSTEIASGNKKFFDKKLEKAQDSGKDIPDFNRIPTAADIKEMVAWGKQYKKLNKRASKRQVRKAVQEHFHIKIYK